MLTPQQPKGDNNRDDEKAPPLTVIVDRSVGCENVAEFLETLGDLYHGLSGGDQLVARREDGLEFPVGGDAPPVDLGTLFPKKPRDTQ